MIGAVENLLAQVFDRANTPKGVRFAAACERLKVRG